jgi:hypothetical protein
MRKAAISKWKMVNCNGIGNKIKRGINRETKKGGHTGPPLHNLITNYPITTLCFCGWQRAHSNYIHTPASAKPPLFLEGITIKQAVRERKTLGESIHAPVSLDLTGIYLTSGSKRDIISVKRG